MTHLHADTHGLHGLPLFDRHLLLWSTNPGLVSERVPSVPAFPPRLFTFLCGPLEGNKVGSMATERAKIPGRTSCPRQRLMLLSGSLDKLGNTEIVVNESVTTLLPFPQMDYFIFSKLSKVNDKVKIVCLKFLQTD